MADDNGVEVKYIPAMKIADGALMKVSERERGT